MHQESLEDHLQTKLLQIDELSPCHRPADTPEQEKC